MSGALAERVFAHKITKVGFTDLTILERRRFSIDDAGRYPLFTDDLIELMRELLPPDRHDDVATSVTLTARKPDDRGPGDRGPGAHGPDHRDPDHRDPEDREDAR